MLLSGLTTLGKTVLLTTAITFIVWAIVTAIFVPRRNPGTSEIRRWLIGRELFEATA